MVLMSGRLSPLESLIDLRDDWLSKVSAGEALRYAGWALAMSSAGGCPRWGRRGRR